MEEDGLFSRSLLSKSGLIKKIPTLTHFLKDFKNWLFAAKCVAISFFVHKLRLRLDQTIFLDDKALNTGHLQLASRMREVGGGHPPPNIKIGLLTHSINEQHLPLTSKIYDSTFCPCMLQYPCNLCNSFNGMLYRCFPHSSIVQLGLLN